MFPGLRTRVDYAMAFRIITTIDLGLLYTENVFEDSDVAGSGCGVILLDLTGS